MICQHCKANLRQTNGRGEHYLRNRGLVFKSTGLTLICPKCKGDVPISGDTMNAIGRAAVVFFQKNS